MIKLATIQCQYIPDTFTIPLLHPWYIGNTFIMHCCVQLSLIFIIWAQIDILFFLSDALGLKAGPSILHRWVETDGKSRYVEFCPEDLSKPYPCKSEPDGKQVALMCGNLFRLDATVKYKEGFETDLLRKAVNSPLAYLNTTSPKYSTIGMCLLSEFWANKSNLGIISKILDADSAEHVKTVMDKKWKMWA